ncbi:MAG: leucyl aminopeptidase [Actinomycetota bacterium]|nr:leucyl aminopeptidase [Actinomycetota bacterium]
MDVAVAETSPEEIEADVLGFPVADPVELSSGARSLDRIVSGRLERLIAEGELTGSIGDVTVVHTVDELAAHRVAAVGVGTASAVDGDGLRTAAAHVAARAGKTGSRTVAWLLEANNFPLASEEQARAVVEGVALGRYDAGRWKTNGDDTGSVDRLVLCGAGAGDVVEEARRAATVAAWTNRCRDVVNAPPNELTPEHLADFAREVAAAAPTLTFEALGPDEIREAGMGALAAVGQGSHNPARLIRVTYEPREPARADFVLGLVGKAITFDSGGISLKPADHLEEMKSDMGGGAAVLAGIGAIAELEVPLRIVAVVPASENMPGGNAYRPGDIVTAMNGKTIEVTNTDAEGRLILADALSYSRSVGATHLLDLATLTGGIVVAMGDLYAGLFGNDASWVETVRMAGEVSGDRVWPWPLHRGYDRYVQSTFADVRNCPDRRRWASPIIAAHFLAEFAGEGPWAHLDIAGTAFLDRSRDDYYRCTGATGFGVRLLAELARRLTA